MFIQWFTIFGGVAVGLQIACDSDGSDQGDDSWRKRVSLSGRGLADFIEIGTKCGDAEVVNRWLEKGSSNPNDMISISWILGSKFCNSRINHKPSKFRRQWLLAAKKNEIAWNCLCFSHCFEKNMFWYMRFDSDTSSQVDGAAKRAIRSIDIQEY